MTWKTPEQETLSPRSHAGPEGGLLTLDAGSNGINLTYTSRFDVHEFRTRDLATRPPCIQLSLEKRTIRTSRAQCIKKIVRNFKKQMAASMDTGNTGILTPHHTSISRAYLAPIQVGIDVGGLY
ncbi:hypothetical protein AVEN_150823-1 [Araneus ventricosus]|uniref:Uncharacterized protein n=1 Tax=Araneus ventricosus TaxID=182803 RepID=A0A4Y2S213_ARAVE|nr:hypothetical protein AVEN_150823-1 [Araneus ventricosus]